jgi:predicted aspartyl protease
LEEAQEAPDIVIGMFFINDTSAVVLLDFGASYSFISTKYVEKNNLPLALLKYQMIISSPRGDIPAMQLCLKVNLKIKGVDFDTNLNVFESKGIDVILGMNWLSKQKVLIDYTKKSIKLTTPDRKELEFVTETVVNAKGVANHAKLNQLDASQEPVGPVVSEFADVFPEELPGMPHDRDIEFLIDWMHNCTYI